MKNKNFVKEGTWFALPLRTDGFGVGLAARVSPKSGAMLAYFFGEKYINIPDIEQLAELKPSDAVLVIRVGDLGLMQGKWKVLGVDKDWKRSSWPNKTFIRRDEFSKKAWEVRYDDDDIQKVASEVSIEYGAVSVDDEDSSYGAGAAEIALTRKIYDLPIH